MEENKLNQRDAHSGASEWKLKQVYKPLTKKCQSKLLEIKLFF